MSGPTPTPDASEEPAVAAPEEASTVERLAAMIQALPPPNRLRLAADLMEARLGRVAHPIIRLVADELGAVLALDAAPTPRESTGDRALREAAYAAGAWGEPNAEDAAAELPSPSPGAAPESPRARIVRLFVEGSAEAVRGVARENGIEEHAVGIEETIRGHVEAVVAAMAQSEVDALAAASDDALRYAVAHLGVSSLATRRPS